jgi:hypothetical protein
LENNEIKEGFIFSVTDTARGYEILSSRMADFKICEAKVTPLERRPGGGCQKVSAFLKNKAR